MIAVILILLFAFICWKKQVHVLGKFDLLLAFGLKLILAFGYFYFYVYISGNGKLEAGNHSSVLVNGDFYTFFSESKELHDVFAKSSSDFFKLFFGLDDSLATKYLEHTEHWTHVKPGIINDSQNVMRVNALFYFIGQGNIAVHFIIVGALTLFSTHFFVEKFAARTQFSPKKLFWILLLLPSFAFSNASIIKEPFLFSGILLAFGAVVNSEKKTFVQWQFYVGILLMLMFKGYVLLFLFPICGIYLISRVIRLNFKYLISVLTICCLLLLVFSTQTQFKLTRTLSEKQYDFMNVARGGVHLTRNDTVFFIPEYQLNQVKFNNEFFVSVKKNFPAFIVQKGKVYPYKKYVFKQADTSLAVYYINPRANTFFEATPINSSFSQLVLNTPEAFFRAAFCPTFSDIGGWKMKFHFFETLFVFGFVFYFFKKYRVFTSSNDRDYQLILISTAFLLFLLIGYTTPVFGAIIRYRLPAYLFLIIACLLSSKKISNSN